MNNRIKQLAHQATEWCKENAQGTPVAWEWEEKFAELIVQECADVELYWLSEQNKKSIAEIIKNHFGVE